MVLGVRRGRNGTRSVVLRVRRGRSGTRSVMLGVRRGRRADSRLWGRGLSSLWAGRGVAEGVALQAVLYSGSVSGGGLATASL